MPAHSPPLPGPIHAPYASTYPSPGNASDGNTGAAIAHAVNAVNNAVDKSFKIKLVQCYRP